MDIDLPEILTEVRIEHERYERALAANDIDLLSDLFRNDPRTVRFGVSENLYGSAAISAFRAARPAIDLARTLSRIVITTFGRDFAVVTTLFHRVRMPGKVGRQMQTWVRFSDGWHIVAAHVSIIDVHLELSSATTISRSKV